MKQGKLFYITKRINQHIGRIFGDVLRNSLSAMHAHCMAWWLPYPVRYSDSETTETSESEAYYSPTELQL
jgi:hypothetical protein